VPSAAGQISLTWTDNSSSETGYRLQRSSDGQSWSQLGSDLAANATSANDATATQKQRYYYRVGALGSGGDVVWSNTAYAFAVYTGGPLSDWVNVTDASKIDFSGCPFPAAPNDGHDDTCGLQKALNLLNNASHPDDPRVLYFPNGTYTISQTLYLEGGWGPQLIGQSAGGVVIQWDTVAGGIGAKDACTGVVTPKVMLTADAPYHLVVSNLVFDGARAYPTETYVVGFDLSACPSNPSNPSYSECNGLGNPWYQLSPTKGVVDSGAGIFDSTFRNAWIGLRISHFNFQDSELSVRRSQFLNNEFGTSVEDFNALQLHFWDCKWDNNRARAITNYIRNFGGTYDGAQADWAGDFTVERGRFTSNGQDVYYSPGGQFRVRDSWSRGSGMFIFGFGQVGSWVNFTTSNNYVDDISPSKILDDYDSMPTPPPCRSFVGVALERGRAIAIQNAGGFVMFDNKFDTPNTSDPLYDPTKEPIYGGTFSTTAILGLSNRYAAAVPYEQTGVNLKLTSINDLTSQTDLNLTIPALPVPVDILAGHAVFTVTDADNAQDVINAAVTAAQSGPTAVHFPTNQYLLTSGLTIPAVPNDLVITGSGTSTKFLWYGAGAGPMLRLGGYQAKTTVRDLSFYATNGSSRADGIVIDDVNSAATRIFMNRVGTYQPRALTPGNPATGGIDVDRVDLPKMDIFDFNAFGYRASFPFLDYDDFLMRVTAGPQTQTLKSIWSSSAGGATRNFIGVNGPQGLKWLIAGSYMEHSKFYLDVSGAGAAGSVSVVGGRMVIERTLDRAAVRVNGFPGNVSVTSSEIFDYDPNSVGVGSTLPPTGAVIYQSGAGPVDIESMGNAFLATPGHEETAAATFTRASDKVHVCDPAYTYSVPPETITLPQCLSYSEIPPGSGLYYLGSPGTGENSADMPDVGVFTNPNSIDVQRLYAGLDLYRNNPIPGYYDEPGAKETYQINLDNVKVWDPITGVRVNGGIPADPTGLAATVISATQVSLTWTDNASNEDGFKVRRATSSGGPYSDLTPNPGPGVTSFSDTTASEGMQYWYRVVAYRTTTGESGAAVTGPILTPPRAPTGLAAAPNGSNAVALTWTDNSTVETGFPVGRDTVQAGSYPIVGTAPAKTGTGSTAFNDTNSVLDGTTYWYRVAAAKTGFPTSAYAGPTSTTTPIKAPTNLNGQALSGPINRITFTDNSASESGFDVQRAVKTGANCGTYTIIATAPASAGTGLTVTYDNSGGGSNPPTPGTTYCYQVRSKNAVSQSAWVGPVSIKTKNN
jgi:hypothetical protein